MKKSMWYLLQLTWGIVMNVAGILGAAWAILRRRDVIKTSTGTFVFCMGGSWGAVTLGMFVFCDQACFYDEEVVKHENGHAIQNIILGPLFLFVIGIPSIVHAALHSKVCKDANYYHFYTEQWASRLGGSSRR